MAQEPMYPGQFADPGTVVTTTTGTQPTPDPARELAEWMRQNTGIVGIANSEQLAAAIIAAGWRKP